MPKPQDPYTRVYWRAIDDPKFVGIWDDDAALAAWLRLLVAADMAWPATASLYHGVKPKALAALVKAGLVDLVAGHRYRIHGLDVERGKRSQQGTLGAAGRWATVPAQQSDMDADGMPNGAEQHPISIPERMPSRVEPSQAEQSRVEPSRAKVDPRSRAEAPANGRVASESDDERTTRLMLVWRDSSKSRAVRDAAKAELERLSDGH